MRLFYFPLEQLEQRMYCQVDSQMKQAFADFGIDYVEILPEFKANEIKDGWVMGASEHCLFCSQQLSIFLEHLRTGGVKDGDILYFNDLWFPGLEALFYSRHLMKKRFSVYGFIHAGSFTKYDFVYPMRNWARDLERSWFLACEGVFVGSQQTKNDIVKCNLVDDSDKIIVTGLPFDIKLDSYEKAPRENIVLFPHRDDPDKRLDDLFRLILLVKKKLITPVKYIITCGGKTARQSTMGLFRQFTEVEVISDLTKDEYYKLLTKAKVMFSSAVQENFGVCVQEALAFGVVPVCPNKLSYKYLLPQEFLYTSLEEASNLVIGGLNGSLKETFGELSKSRFHPYAASLIVHYMLANEGE